MGKALDDLNAKFDALDAAIDEIAKEIAQLITGGDGATQAQLVSLQAKVEAATAKLTAMDPNPGSSPGGTPPAAQKGGDRMSLDPKPPRDPNKPPRQQLKYFYALCGAERILLHGSQQGGIYTSSSLEPVVEFMES